jgi:hypothetical protein
MKYVFDIYYKYKQNEKLIEDEKVKMQKIDQEISKKRIELNAVESKIKPEANALTGINKYIHIILQRDDIYLQMK